MPRAPHLLLILLVPSLLAGCGAAVSAPVSRPRAAGPQGQALGWVESVGPPSTRLVFRVRGFHITRDGWNAGLSVTNDTATTFSIVDQNDVPDQTFGLMVFRTGSHAELEERNTQAALPVLRGATTFSPRLPTTLGPHTTWRGTASAAGALPAGFWIRFVFGVFVPNGKLPEALAHAGASDLLVWITDHAHRLR